MRECENTLENILTGFAAKDKTALEAFAEYPGWAELAEQELRRRRFRLLESLPDAVLEAIARGDIRVDELASRMLSN